MNVEKLKKLQAEVRIGGKGTPRRKKKIIHSNPAVDDKKVQSSIKKISAKPIPGIEEVNIIKNDSSIIHFNCPKLEAALSSNTFIITGHGEKKFMTQTMPNIFTQMGLESMAQKIPTGLASKSGAAAGAIDEDVEDDVLDLVENFEEFALGAAAAYESSKAAKSPE